MKHPVVRGHPLHAVLSDAPAVMIPVAFAFTAAHRLRRNDRTAFASAAMTWLALTGALAAGAAGWWDWLTMPRDWKAWKLATVHGLVNTSGLVALATAAVRPRRRLGMLTLASAAAVGGGVLGGELVFRHGWRVRPAEEAEIVEENLRSDHLERYLDRAREEVESFERSQTFLPAP
jgi:uncharacterized membrane protein